MTALSFHATRLAPSPTGALHLGHARTFLVTWWMARQEGAKIYMRMEDLDAGRANSPSVRQAYDDLQWLGMTWDSWQENAAVETRAVEMLAGVDGDGSVVQSRRLAEYQQTLEALWKRGVVYPCTCTRAEIAASVNAGASAPHEGEGHVRYPGTCAARNWGVEQASASVIETAARVRAETAKNVCWRLRVRAGPILFDDAIAGPQAFDVAAEAGDFPVTRFADTDAIPPAYQLACVDDDHAMGIDMVIRGDDLLSSTPRQMLIYQAMGWPVPRFAHVPLVIGADGKRLAKRHGESRIAQFRNAGVPAERLVGWAAWRAGQLESPREASAAEMISCFDLHKLPRDRLVLTEADFAWLRWGA